MTDGTEIEAAPSNHASWYPALFLGLFVAIGILFALYALLWDGGAHT
jgi:hypothetical protein